MHNLDWPLPLVLRGCFTQGLPSLPLQHGTGERELVLGLDDHLLDLAHPDLLLGLLDGVAVLHDGDPLVYQGLGMFSVRIFNWHLGKGSQILAEND